MTDQLSTPAPVDLEGLTKHIDGFEKAGRFDVVLSTDTAKALLSEIERLERIADAARDGATHAKQHRGPNANQPCPQCLAVLRPIAAALNQEAPVEGSDEYAQAFMKENDV